MDENQVYALVLKGSVDIQGLIALQNIDDYNSVYISWMCAAPQNNPMIVPTKKYLGLGGHLFAIAVECSIRAGYEGAITANAANKIKEVYDYEWTDDEL